MSYKKLLKMNNIVPFFDQLFENINIYQTFIVYNFKNKKNINKLNLELTKSDYPSCLYTRKDKDLYRKYRLFFISLERFQKYILESKKLQMVSIIMCLDSYSYTTILESLENKDMSNNIYIFSSIKI